MDSVSVIAARGVKLLTLTPSGPVDSTVLTVCKCCVSMLTEGDVWEETSWSDPPSSSCKE